MDNGYINCNFLINKNVYKSNYKWGIMMKILKKYLLKCLIPEENLLKSKRRIIYKIVHSYNPFYKD